MEIKEGESVYPGMLYPPVDMSMVYSVLCTWWLDIYDCIFNLPEAFESERVDYSVSFLKSAP
jgi:hypothetical protein